jgi:hypothetical protein
MVKINKKGYMQTLEAVIALMILLGVIIFSISLKEPPKQAIPEDIRLTQDAILGGLEYDQHVRGYIMKGMDISAISIYSQLLGSAPEGIKMGFSVDDLFTFPYQLHATKKNVYADSIILANESNGFVRTFTLYLWHVDEEITSPCATGILGGLSFCTNALECVNELNTTINNASIMENIMNGLDIQCNGAGNCTYQPYTC